MDSIAFTQERMKRQFDDLQDKTQVWFYAQSKHPVLHKGDFQLLDLILPELKSHVIPYKFKCSHWSKIHL